VFFNAAYSHNGRKTNSLSSMSLCGICKRSWSTVSPSYRRMSRSMFRGPLSIVFCLPRRFSIACNLSSNARGPRVVSIYVGSERYLASVPQMGRSHTSQAPLRKFPWSSTYIGAVSYRQLVRRTDMYSSFSISLHAASMLRKRSPSLLPSAINARCLPETIMCFALLSLLTADCRWLLRETQNACE